MKWHEVFRYRDGKLFWKIKPCQRVRIGDEEGVLNNYGYLLVRYKGKTHVAHRIIYQMAEGFIPQGYDVDHVNGNRCDNRIDNLRVATRSQNAWNSCKRKSNTSGFKGVSWNSVAKKWQAQIMKFRKKINLGYFTTVEGAYAARLAAEKEIHGDFAATELRKLAMA